MYDVFRSVVLGSIAKIQWDSNWCNFVEAMLQQSLFKKGECNQNVLMISAIQRIVMSIPLLPTDTIGNKSR